MRNLDHLKASIGIAFQMRHVAAVCIRHFSVRIVASGNRADCVERNDVFFDKILLAERIELLIKRNDVTKVDSEAFEKFKLFRSLDRYAKSLFASLLNTIPG